MNEYLVDYLAIAYPTIVYPTIGYVFFLFCKKYYKYMLDLYNENSDISTSLISNKFFKQFDMYDNTDNYEHINKETQIKIDTDNVLFAFNQIPT
jgi:hypothetical protein